MLNFSNIFENAWDIFSLFLDLFEMLVYEGSLFDHALSEFFLQFLLVLHNHLNQHLRHTLNLFKFLLVVI